MLNIRCHDADFNGFGVLGYGVCATSRKQTPKAIKRAQVGIAWSNRVRRSRNRITRPATASRRAKTVNEADEAITCGTGNVFADLGYADAEERQTKLRLAHAINGVIARRRLTHAGAAEKLGINQPKVSALANYKLDGFSVERLMTFLTALDQDVEIVIRKKPRSRAMARISVVAA
jgi:predicted XRE-type DNA-binding protein